MSVNRNILKSYSNPVLEPNQVPIELVTNAGSRWVILNWPVKTYISSSQGGDCEGLTVQWSTDSRFASEPDNYYTNITSSVLSCDSSSLIPLTGSLGWSIFINSTYNFQADNPTTSSVYYIRSFQNTSGGGRGPYSNVLSLDTRAPNIYNNGALSMTLLGAPVTSSNPALYKSGTTGSILFFTTDSYNPTSSNLQAWSANSTTGNGYVGIFSSSNAAVTASITGSGTYIMKTLGPNYDGIATNGATWSLQLYGSPSASTSEPNTINNSAAAPTSSIALVALWSGSMEIIGNQGFQMKVSATPSSSKVGSGTPGVYKTENAVTTQYGAFSMNGGYSTINTPVGCYDNVFIYGQYKGGFVGFQYPGVAQTASAATRALGSQVTIQTSPDCVFNLIALGERNDVQQYLNQYGVYNQPWSVGVSGSSVLPIPSSSVLQLWSGFGYRYSPYEYNGYPTSSFGWMDNNPVASKWSYVNGANFDYPGLVTSSLGYSFTIAGAPYGDPYITILSSSVAGIAQKDYTIQFAGTLPDNGINTRYGLLGKWDGGESAVLRTDVSGGAMFLDLLALGGNPQYRFEVIPSSSANQLLTIIRSGSNTSVYQGLNKLTPTPGGRPNSGSWDVFNYSTPNGPSINFGNIDNPASFATYTGVMNSLLIYSRSLSDSELTASYDYFL
jgi:hypothetical protein